MCLCIVILSFASISLLNSHVQQVQVPTSYYPSSRKNYSRSRSENDTNSRPSAHETKLCAQMRLILRSTFPLDVLEPIYCDPGQYTQCGADQESLVWFLVGGHLRSFADKLGNFESFVKPAKCFFLVFYIRYEVESTTSSWWKATANSSEHGEDAVAILQDLFLVEGSWLKTVNYAFFAISQGEKGGDPHDVFNGLWLFQQLLERRYNLHDTHALFVKMRPDLLFSHSPNYGQLRKTAKVYTNVSRTTPQRERDHTMRGFVLFLRHDTSEFTVLDPSEMFWVCNRYFFESLFHHKAPHDVLERKAIFSTEFNPFFEGPTAGCCMEHQNSQSFVPNQTCGTTSDGTFASLLVFRPNRLGMHVFFIREDFKVHILRRGGDFSSAVNRPGQVALVKPEEYHNRSLDLTLNVTQVVAGVESYCNDYCFLQTQSGYFCQPYRNSTSIPLQAETHHVGGYNFHTLDRNSMISAVLGSLIVDSNISTRPH